MSCQVEIKTAIFRTIKHERSSHKYISNETRKYQPPKIYFSNNQLWYLGNFLSFFFVALFKYETDPSPPSAFIVLWTKWEMKAMRQLKLKEKYVTDGEERDLARHPAAGGGGEGVVEELMQLFLYKVLLPKLWDPLWMINRLIRVCHIYSSPPSNPILYSRSPP